MLIFINKTTNNYFIATSDIEMKAAADNDFNLSEFLRKFSFLRHYFHLLQFFSKLLYIEILLVIKSVQN